MNLSEHNLTSVSQRRNKFISAILLVFSLVFISSCYKKQDTIAILNVRNANGTYVENARVILYGSGSLGEVNVQDTVFTNAEGEALFNLNNIYQSGQAGVAILDVEVSKGSSTVNGVIKVEQETTTKETIILN